MELQAPQDTHQRATQLQARTSTRSQPWHVTCAASPKDVLSVQSLMMSACLWLDCGNQVTIAVVGSNIQIHFFPKWIMLCLVHHRQNYQSSANSSINGVGGDPHTESTDLHSQIIRQCQPSTLASTLKQAGMCGSHSYKAGMTFVSW